LGGLTRAHSDLSAAGAVSVEEMVSHRAMLMAAAVMTWKTANRRSFSSQPAKIVHPTRVSTDSRRQSAGFGFAVGKGVIFLVAAGKAANLEGERPLPSIARFRTASISDAHE
jgi:hypothetical protein